MKLQLFTILSPLYDWGLTGMLRCLCYHTVAVTRLDSRIAAIVW